jgi:putative ABC transport system substrate-binding protein
MRRREFITLGKLGWTEGRNIQIDHRWGAVDVDRLRAAAAELVEMAPEVILARRCPSVGWNH